MPIRPAELRLRALRLLATLALVSLVTFIDYRLLGVNSSTAAFSYLLVVLGLATRVGLAESITASLAAMLGYNYFFLPPVGKFTIADPQNWAALIAFLVTAVTASHLSASARRRAEEASARQQEMERVYEFSRALMLGDGDRSLASQIATQVTAVFGATEAAFFETASDTVWRAGGTQHILNETELREASRIEDAQTAPTLGVTIVPVRLGGRILGSLGVGGSELSVPALQAVAQLSAIALERSRAQEVAARAEATRHNEQLKSTLLDALAHEFKTPLTSIKAAISTVLSYRKHDEVEQELLSVVDEETDRLTSMVTEAIAVARIGAGNVRLKPEPYAVPDLVAATLAELRQFAEGRKIEVQLPESLPDVEIDPSLTELALRQLLGNALKYAPLSSPIRVSAESDGTFVTLHVANDGPGISRAEQESIFEKFYRGQEARDRIPGSGMGLTIAREIIDAQGGRIWVESATGKGVRFSFTLPVSVQQIVAEPSHEPVKV